VKVTPPRRVLQVDGPLGALAWSPRGSRLAVGCVDGTVRFVNRDGRGRPGWQAHLGVVHAVAWGRGGATLATGSSNYTVKLWHAASGTQRALLHDDRDRVMALAFAPDGRWLACGARDEPPKLWEVGQPRHGTIRMWDWERGASLVWAAHDDLMTHLSFGADGTLFSASLDGSARAWRWDGDALHPLASVWHPAAVRGLVSMRDGALITACDDGVLRRWRTPVSVQALLDGGRPWLALTVHSVVAAGSADGVVALLSAEGDAFGDFQVDGAVSALAFGVDGTLAIGTAAGSLYLWKS
jgi:WD40 repeat protein